VAPVSAFSAAASSRAALAALRGIIVLRRLPAAGRTVRAADFTCGLSRRFAVEASAHYIRRGAEITLAGIYRRLLTSCAHRLRKPEPDQRNL
jgi:hypothetical protein